MSKKIIVTGISGQDGSYMVDYLLENTKHEVIGCVRRTSQLINKHFSNHINNKRFRLEFFDLMDTVSIESLLRREKPDYFFNFAAQTFVGDSWNMPLLHYQCNSVAVINILESIRKHCPDCRFWNSGSSEQFGDVLYSPQDIGHPFMPRSPYGASKCSAHHAVKVWRESYDMFAVQGILFNHESERRQEYFVTRKITKFVANFILAPRSNRFENTLELGNLEAKRDWSHAKDFVRGVWLMMNMEEPKDYVLASGETYSVREFVEKSFELSGFYVEWFGSDNPLEEVGYVNGNPIITVNKKFFRPAEVNLLVGDAEPARKELGWEPQVSFEELIAKMINNDYIILDGFNG